MAVIEFGRNVLGWSDAHSTEMDAATTHPVIALMEEQKKIKSKGGTMRLGAYDCDIDKESLAYQIYDNTQISERHRHRWEFNNNYLSDYTNAGLIPSGKNTIKNLVEIVELKDHLYHPKITDDGKTKDDKKDGGRSSTPKAPKERTSVTVRSRRSHHVFLKKDLQLDTEGVDSCKQRVTFGEIHRWV